MSVQKMTVFEWLPGLELDNWMVAAPPTATITFILKAKTQRAERSEKQGRMWGKPFLQIVPH